MSRPTAGDLGRLAITPKWLGMAGVLVAFLAVCLVAGHWQWTRTQDILAAERAAQSAAIAVEDVAQPSESLPNAQIGRPVTARGEYVAPDQVIVMQRSLDGQPGIWVLTPLRLPDNSVVGVLRGWLPNAQSPGVVPPAGTVVVHGVMHPDERFYAGAESAPGTTVSVATQRLADAWGGNVRPGFIMLASQEPTSPSDPKAVPPTVRADDVGFPLRNFGYAIQWYLFALFAIVVFGRWLWLDAARSDEGDEVTAA